MSNANDVIFLQVARDILEEFGVAGSLLIKSEGGFDVSTGEVATSTEIIPVSKISPPIQYDNNAIDGTLVKKKDFMVYVANEDSIDDIDIVDEVTVNGLTASVVGSKPIHSGEDVAIWELQLRSGNSGA